MSEQTSINDEVLSAFLDAELPEQQMQLIRDQLLVDEQLANRLAELAMVDELISTQYDTINQQPLPTAVVELLKQQKMIEKSDNKVVVLSTWQRVYKKLQQHVALAASIAVMLGFGLANWHHSNNNEQWQEIANILESSHSGKQNLLTNGDTLTTRLTFINHQNEYCRQFDINAQQLEHNIACRVNEQWQKITTIYQKTNIEQNVYQTANNNNMLRTQIEEMANGDFINKQQEDNLIANSWKN